MFVVIPHVGKSHLTLQTLRSIPDCHRTILVDGSFVADLDVYAEDHPATVEYCRTKEPLCLAANWNIGADLVPEEEPGWLFAASDVQFYAESWRRLEEALRCYPDAAIVRDHGTNWNVWYVRRWAWRLLAPMDERYRPCGGEDDDLVMKCHHAGLRIRSAWIGVNHLEGGHATRLDIRRDLAGTDWSGREANIRVFRSKWGCTPSLRRDPIYREAHDRVHIQDRRSEPPPEWSEASIPTDRPPWPDRSWPSPLRLNVGSGRRAKRGWVNADADPQAPGTDVLFDAGRDRWPFDDGTVDSIEAFHVLEHLSREEGAAFLREAFRVLRPGGDITIECPDLAGVVERWPSSQARMTWSLYGDQGSPWRFHRWGYSRESIGVGLIHAGFEQVDVGPGTDYHSDSEPCLRATARKASA